MSAQKVLEKALQLISGDRADTHGSMWKNHENIAKKNTEKAVEQCTFKPKINK